MPTEAINTANEFLVVGSIFKRPELLVEYSRYIKSKYDFSDKATIFLYDSMEIMYSKRTQNFNQNSVITFMAEDKERLKIFKDINGWKLLNEWGNLAEPENFKNYFEVLKKYSLLREYEREGFNISKILNHPKFEAFSALDIYRLIRAKADRVHTAIIENSEIDILNKNIKKTLLNCMDIPDMGLITPYPLWNDIFRGLRDENLFVVGMLSNAGKSRFMFKLIAYITLALKEKVFVMLNEMTLKQMKFCLITTVINNCEFQELFKIKLNKKEKEIALGLYKDDYGDFIYRKTNENGDFINSLEEHISEVESKSSEYRNIMAIADWIESETEGLIISKELNIYDDKTLEFEIRKSVLTSGTRYIFYDTLKDDIRNIGDWSGLKKTTTKLSELAKELKIFLYGSIQLTDDAEYVSPDDLTSMNIANCKQLKHLVDSLMLFKEIKPTEIFKYGYIAFHSDWGTPSVHNLEEGKKYYCGVVDKNRAGEKKKILYEVNLDYNTWYELGELIRR